MASNILKPERNKILKFIYFFISNLASISYITFIRQQIYLDIINILGHSD